MLRPLPVSLASGTLGLLAVTLLRAIVPPAEWGWAPMWALLTAVACLGLLGALRHRREAADPLSRLTGRPPDGRNVLFKNAAAVASLAYGWLGLVLLYRTAIRLASRGAALLASLGIGFGSFLYG